MDAKSWIETAMAVFTAMLAFATFWLAYLTRKLEMAWFKTSSEQIGVNTWLELERRFDSQEMKRARKKLAGQLETYSTAKHGDISETVLDFFESVGTAYREGHLNKKLAASSFSFHACRWWEAAKAYVDHEQRRHGEDDTLYEDFKHFAEPMRLQDEVINHEEVQRFLADEMKLE